MKKSLLNPSIRYGIFGQKQVEMDSKWKVQALAFSAITFFSNLVKSSAHNASLSIGSIPEALPSFPWICDLWGDYRVRNVHLWCRSLASRTDLTYAIKPISGCGILSSSSWAAILWDELLRRYYALQPVAWDGKMWFAKYVSCWVVKWLGEMD